MGTIRCRSMRGFWIAVLAFFVAAVAISWFRSWRDPFDDRPFQSTVWKEADSDSRAAMARDLVSNRLTPGMTQVAVTELLGTPDQVKSGPQDKIFSYHIGSWSMYGFDDAFVYVYFDASQKVLKAEIGGY
jgi:hypothetical protein